jgi:arylsulfatase A-like enzyme
MSSRPANVLLIITDQQRFDSIGAYGSRATPTPNIDGLGEAGVTFDNCYVNCPICTPSRASIFTGKSMIGHGVSTVHDILPPCEVLFPERLRRAGYRTGLFGKLHVSGRVHERDHRHPNDGFDVYEYSMSPHARGGTYNSYERWLKENHPKFFEKRDRLGRKVGNFPIEASFTHWVAERTCRFLDEQNGDQPFFAYMGIFDPHDPYNDFPTEMKELLDPAALGTPRTRPGLIDSAPEAVRREHRHGYLGGFGDYTPDQITLMREGYFASIALMDREIGRVLDRLEERGLAQDTLVVFTSDHGDMLGDHELLAKGGFFYDASTRVPMLMRFPERIPAGVRKPEPVQPQFLAPTICKLAGIDAEELRISMPEQVDLVELANGSSSANERVTVPPAVCLYRNTGINRDKVHWDPPIHGSMLREGNYKLTCYHRRPGTPGEAEGELFDLAADPDEFNNLWYEPEYQGVKQDLMFRLMDWMVSQNHLYNDGRAGAAFPPKTQWVLNNPI